MKVFPTVNSCLQLCSKLTFFPFLPSIYKVSVKHLVHMQHCFVLYCSSYIFTNHEQIYIPDVSRQKQCRHVFLICGHIAATCKSLLETCVILSLKTLQGKIFQCCDPQSKQFIHSKHQFSWLQRRRGFRGDTTSGYLKIFHYTVRGKVKSKQVLNNVFVGQRYLTKG